MLGKTPNEEKEKNIETDVNKMGFFKKVWYSITKLEKYSELSEQGFSKAIRYIAQLAIIMSIVSSLISVYGTKKEVDEIASYINENAPEFIYKDETLSVETDEAIINDNTSFGKIILDAETEDEQKIQEYLTQIEDNEIGVLILKDKLIMKQSGTEDITYEYKDLFAQLGISEFNKQDLVNYLTNNKIYAIYLNLFVVLALYAVIIYFINIIFIVFIISIFGFLATVIIKLKTKYVTVFNMAAYSITLSTILNIIYMIVNSIFGFTINYFDVMYILVASIYMIAAIFIQKTDLTRKQEVVQKIEKVQEEVHEEVEKEKEEGNET